MTTFRDIKRAARRDLHAIMKTPALYIATPGDPGVAIDVRLHTKFDLLALDAGPTGLASRREMKPKIIFMRSELLTASIVLSRGGMISVEVGEAYELDNADAPDDISVTWFVSPVTTHNAIGLPVPGAGDE